MRGRQFQKKFRDEAKRNLIRKKSVKNFRAYCLSILSDSTLTGISTIINSKGRCYKSLKIFILAFSVAGFLCQTFQFLQLYWEFSTVESVRGMTTMVKPAITICDENWIRRTYLCKVRSDLCTFLPESDYDRFCEEFPMYCEDPLDVLLAIPILESFPDEFYEWNFTKESGFQIEDNLVSCVWYTEESETRNITFDSTCRKTSYVRSISSDKVPVPCYTLYSHRGENNYTEEIFKSDTMLTLTLKWIGKEQAYPDVPLQYWLSFHHPGSISNPWDEGFKVYAALSYKVQIHQENIVRLRPPYDSHCHDYLTVWNKNGGIGPLKKWVIYVSFTECQQICEIKVQLEFHGCVFRESTYPHEERICPTSPPFNSKLNNKIRHCYERCKDACFETKYVSELEILNQITKDEAIRKYGSRSAVVLQIQFNVLESRITLERPKYETVELFSYIGGYLGMWLGWSLVTLLDFFGTMVNLCKYPFMLKRKRRKADTVRNFRIDCYQ